MQYYIFGSMSSVDVDIMVIVDKIPDTIRECQELCKQYEEKIQPEYKRNGATTEPGKKVNVNICTINNGIVTNVFKGTPDEVNNSLIDTCHLHKQKYLLAVTKRVERDVGLKFMRAARIILSFLSRTEHRKEIKRALRGDFNDKLDVLESIDFRTINNLGNKNVDKLDFEKTIAFQLGQALALVYGHIEVYSKENIAQIFPGLYTLLFRFGDDYHMAVIESFKKLFIEEARKVVLPKMKALREI